MNNSHRGHRRLFLATAAIAALHCATPGESSPPTAKTFHLVSQKLGNALRAVGRESGREIMFSSEAVVGKESPALDGTMTADQAVAKLLEGSGLAVDYREDVILIRGRSETTAGEIEGPRSPDIVVTGSRIRGAPIASPMIRLTQGDIQGAGENTIADVLRDIPQNSGGGQNPGIGNNVPTSSGVNIGSGSTINLRGLGSDATLTLVNGHRLAYNISRQGIDVSAIPIAALDRIEIVADGSSALYGSDAVAGVANIILKRDFEGLTASARLGAATDGGDEQQDYSLVGGHTWSTGGVMLAYDFEKDTSITARERSYAAERAPGLTLLPAMKHHNVVFTGHQAITPGLHFDIDAFYNWRQAASSYSAAPDIDYVILSSSRTKSFVAAPSFTLDLPGNWRLQLPTMIGVDRTHYGSNQYQDGELVVPVGGCYCNTAKSIELGADGPLFHLPGGSASIAVGGGFRTNHFHGTQAVFGELFTDVHAKQDVTFAYGELNLPLVGPDQGIPLVHMLNLSGALRWEDYRSIDQVVTPKIGLIYAPTADLDVKASWGRSFKAPTLYELYSEGFAFLRTAASLGATGGPPDATALLVSGGNPALKPERARNWSTSVVLHPTWAPSARLEVGYFNIHYRDRVVSPITYLVQALSNPIYADLIQTNPSSAMVEAAQAGKDVENDTDFDYDSSNVAAIVNNQYLNVASQTIQGIDVAGSYKLLLGDRSAITLLADASYLDSKQRLSAAQPTVKLAGTLFNPPHLRARGGLVWAGDGSSVSAFVNYIGGVDDVRLAPTVRVGSMTTADVTARYVVKSDSNWLRGLEFSVSAQNLFNAKPKVISTVNIYDAPYDSTNYSPIGRFVSFTLSKHW